MKGVDAMKKAVKLICQLQSRIPLYSAALIRLAVKVEQILPRSVKQKDVTSNSQPV